MALIVGLSGCDGSGKTTLARATVAALGHRDRVLYHHELDLVVVTPLVHLFTRLLGRSVTTAKHRILDDVEDGAGLSTPYYLLLWSDSWLAYVWFRLRRGIVVHDRWIYDVQAAMDRRGYRNRLVRWLYRRFPRPDLYVLLTVNPRVARERKASDPGHLGDAEAFYEECGAAIGAIAAGHHPDLILNGDEPSHVLTSTLLRAIEERRR